MNFKNALTVPSQMAVSQLLLLACSATALHEPRGPPGVSELRSNGAEHAALEGISAAAYAWRRAAQQRRGERTDVELEGLSAAAYAAELQRSHAEARGTAAALEGLRGGDARPAQPPLSPKVVAAYAAAGLATTVVRAAVARAGPAPWQAAVAACWTLNNVAVMVPGRYDGGGDGAPTAATANLLAPAGWAFAIWGPIFLGECLTMLLVTAADPGHPVFDVGAAIAAPWCAGTLCQVAWCGLFRPSVCGPGALWIPSAALGATAFFLGKAHAALQGLDLYAAGPLRGLRNDLLVRWPLALHFAWVTCATLVNVNKYLALRGSDLRVKEAGALGSVAVAAAAAAYVLRTTGDPLYGFVVAWALAAVAADGGRQAARGLVPDAPIDRVVGAAKAAAVAVGAVACVAPFAADVADAYHARGSCARRRPVKESPW